MAEFTIREIEGMRQVSARIRESSIRARSGALSHMDGKIDVEVPLPGPLTLLRSAISNEAAIRPRYTGTGSIHLEASMGGYHVFEARHQRWILEPGVFWAAEGEVDLGIRREAFLTSFWAGDGLLNYQTTVQGDGKVVINAPGPVEEVDLDDSEIVVQGRLVLGRTDGLRYRVRRVTGYFRALLSGEPLVRSYAGTGKVLVCWTPYWNQYMHDLMMKDREAA